MKKKFSKKAKIICVAVAGVLIIGSIGAWYAFSGMNVSDEDKVYVESVAELAGLTSVNGSQNRYTGTVEAQETYKIEKDSETKVKDILVKVGDTIEVGQELFTYDVEDLQTQLDTANLEIEKQNNTISDNNAEIKQAEADKASAPADQKLEYNVTINTAKADIKTAEYEIIKKQREVESLTKKIENATEKSEVAGVVKSINNTESSDESSMDTDSTDTSFMTILATGNYRVKGTVSEQTAQTLAEGDSVIIRSRISEEDIWKGTIQKVDFDNTVQTSSEDMMYAEGSSDTSNTATKVPFYIELDNSEGLIMGQHVFIELDQGQLEEKEGIWLTESYIVQDGESAYVWVSDKKDRLEKRTVTLGEYNEELFEYQITEGLTEDDMIAFPREDFEEGMLTTTELVIDESETDETMEDGEVLEGEDAEGMEGEVIEGEDITEEGTGEEVMDDAAISEEGLQEDAADTQQTDSAEVEE